MKDIKTFVIGFLTCACLFLIMGQIKADNDDYEMEMNVSGGTIKIGNENGRYQISTTSSVKIGTTYWIHETTFDTQTGEVIKRESYHQKLYDKHK